MRSHLSKKVLFLTAFLGVFLCASAASADEDAPDVVAARAEFVRGTGLAKSTQWAEALVAFEKSSKLRPHAVTTYNVGICHRAMGNYTIARDALSRAVAENDAAGGKELGDALLSDSKALLAEIDGLLASATVQLHPANAKVAVDGRPLALTPGSGEPVVLVAGVRAPGAGETPPSGTFKVFLNPGAHVFTFSRAGFADSVINRTLTPGSAIDLKLELDRLPATLRVASNEPGAVVTVNEVDVGLVPVDVSRPAGSYKVSVKKEGFKRYDAQVALQPGQEIDLRAPLSKEETAITKRWWFWTAAGTLLVGAVAGTYVLTRGETRREEPLDGGGLGWTVKIQ